MDILIATAVVGAIGLILGVALVAAGRKFQVETDPREAAVRELLPGNNCGACGFAGCDAVAAAIVKGEAPANACPVCSADKAEGIASVMGVEARASERRAAFVHCGGDCEKTSVTARYIGVTDCRAAALAGINPWACAHGCLGFGSCVEACQYGAIHVTDGVASVDTGKCVGCGLCAAACPQNLITLLPAGRTHAVVRCASPERGVDVRKLCSAGCLGCGICVRQCAEEAVAVTGNLAAVDPAKCVGCGKCVEKCPTHTLALTR